MEERTEVGPDLLGERTVKKKMTEGLNRRTSMTKEGFPLCFSERNVLIASGTYKCSYSQRNYLVFWKSVLMADVLIARVSYDVLITRVLITRVDCILEICSDG